MKEADDILTSDCEKAFCDYIQQRTGILIHDHQRQGLRETIVRACAHFSYPDGDAFLSALTSQSQLSSELEFLIAGITVGESYFFRDPEQIALLREKLLPEIINRKRLVKQRMLRIWSAGCSQGQEIYTVVILLHQILPDFNNWVIHFLATDINNEALMAAKKGCYNAWALRLMSPNMCDKYFIRKNNEFELKPEISKPVKFTHLNLTEDSFPSFLTDTNAIDIILCKNVFIYLAPQVIESVMEKFSRCLQEDGILLLGASDPVIKGEIFKYIQVGNTSYLQLAHVKEKVEIKKADVFVEHLILHHEMSSQEPLSLQEAEHKISELLASDRWHDVIALLIEFDVEHITSSQLLQFKAKALASLGQLDAALAAADKSILKSPSNINTYLLRAIILIELHRLDEAETALRKALYLDRYFLEAHYELGLLLLKKGDIVRGLKSLSNALKIAKQGDPEQTLSYAKEMTYYRFSEILKCEIEIYKDFGVQSKPVF